MGFNMRQSWKDILEGCRQVYGYDRMMLNSWDVGGIFYATDGFYNPDTDVVETHRIWQSPFAWDVESFADRERIRCGYDPSQDE